MSEKEILKKLAEVIKLEKEILNRMPIWIRSKGKSNTSVTWSTSPFPAMKIDGIKELEVKFDEEGTK